MYNMNMSGYLFFNQKLVLEGVFDVECNQFGVIKITIEPTSELNFFQDICIWSKLDLVFFGINPLIAQSEIIKVDVNIEELSTENGVITKLKLFGRNPKFKGAFVS